MALQIFLGTVAGLYWFVFLGALKTIPTFLLKRKGVRDKLSDHFMFTLIITGLFLWSITI